MVLRRIGRHIRKQDWFAVTIDFFVVIVGLFMAFQADRWWEQRDNRSQEHAYIERLIVDLEIDIPKIQYAIDLQELRLGLVELLMETAGDPSIALEHPVMFLSAIEQAAFTYTPSLTRYTFEDLRSTGNMRLILSQEIKQSLYGYYAFDESQRQYRPLQFSTEFHHFTLVAGLLNLEQARFLQDRWLYITPMNQEEVKKAQADPKAVLNVARELGMRPEVVAWLPQLRSMQLEQIDVHQTRLEIAQSLMQILQQYAQRRP